MKSATKEKSSTALITGASSGIGAEFCRQLSSQCDTIIVVARRYDQLQKLKEERHSCCPVPDIDLRVSGVLK